MKRLILVTGSSRGIGEAVVHEFNHLYKTDTHFVLLARDANKLDKVMNKLVNDSCGQNSASIIQIDFSVVTQLDEYFKLLKEHFAGKQIQLTDFDELTCVYNHGTMEFGNVVLKVQEPLRSRFEINLFSVWNLLAAIGLLIPTTVVAKQFHVNMNSGYATRPKALWSGMCCTRASREMLFRCFALENPDLRVLQYDPGFVLTDMLDEYIEINKDFKDANGEQFVTPETTARRLVAIVHDNSFTNAARVKYEDFN